MTRTPEQRRHEHERQEAADAASVARLLKWLRREVNRDLREWRGHLKAGTGGPLTGRIPDLIADCKAKLVMIAWAEHWHAGWLNPDYALVDRERHMVMHGVRKVAAGYSNRDGYRGEWGSA